MIAAPLRSTITLADAIRTIGTPTFPLTFAGLLATQFQADQTIVFKAGGPGPIRTMLAQNLRDGAGHARSLAERYTAGLWARDPQGQSLSPVPRGGTRDIILRATRAEEIADGEYRHCLFAEPRLGAKAALIVRTPEHALYVNLYRGVERTPFAPGELAAVGRACDELVALLERHFALAGDDTTDEPGAVRRAIEAAECEGGRAPLSAREAAVCTRIVAGCSTEAIGIDLGVSRHSVISYRRRAFEKLGIATQRELFTLVLRRHRPPMR